MKILFDGIPLDKMSVSMTMNGAVLPIMAMYIVAAEEQGVAPDQLAGTLQNDILKEFMVRNTYIYPPEPSMRIVSDIIALHGRQHAALQLDLDLRLSHAGSRGDLRPGTRLHDRRRHRVRARGHRKRPRRRQVRAAPVVLLRHRHELLHGSRQAARRAPALVHAHGREVLAQRPALADAAHALPDLGRRASPPTTLTTTSCASRTQAMAAVLGGTQSLHTNSFDEALALPTDFSAGIARNTQLVLQEESGITDVVDPLAGSYYVEKLTADLAAEARKLIDEVEEMGGMTKAVETGMPKLRIEEAAAIRQARIDRGEEVIVGVNKYRAAEETPVEIRDIDNTAVRDAQIAAPRAGSRESQ